MSDAQITTLFRFACSRCGHLNEYEHRHAPSVQPHLVSSRCPECLHLNWLGGLHGTVVSETPSDAFLTASSAA